MDYFLSLTYTLLFLLSLAPLFFLLKRRSTGSGLPNLPPGSFGWPVIGETLEFFSEDPESFIRKRLEKHSTTVFKTNILGQNAVVISGAEANKLITSNENKLVKIWFTQSQQGLFGVKNSHAPAKPITNSNGLNKPPPGLGRLYGLLKPGPESVEKFDSLMKHQLRKFCPQGDESKVMIRAYDLIRNFTLTASCDYLLGMEPERAVARLAGRFDDIVNGIQSIHVAVPGTAYYKAKKAAAAVRSEIEAVMKEKSAAAAEGGDVVSKLIGEEKAMVAMGVAVANIVMGNMSASYGSVVTAVAFMVKFVGERPDVYDKIYSEQSEILASKGSDPLNWNHINRMKYTWAAALETMRLAPPFVGTYREAITDFDYAGFTIPKGWKIFWAMSVTNRNPEYFSDPEKFEPSRFLEKEHLPYTFLPFGAGPRMCAGNEYARLAILVFMHNLVTKFKWDVLFPDEKVSGGMIMPAPVKGLPVRLHPRPSSVAA